MGNGHDEFNAGGNPANRLISNDPIQEEVQCGSLVPPSKIFYDLLKPNPIICGKFYMHFRDLY